MATVKEKQAVIYVKETDIPVTKTRQALIKLFITNKGYQTFTDKNCTQIQCEKGRFRSITELYQMVLSRFPHTTFDAILRIVDDLIKKEKGFIMIYCSTINKVVLRYIKNETCEMISEYSRSNYYNKEGVDGSSLEKYEKRIQQILKELGK